MIKLSKSTQTSVICNQFIHVVVIYRILSSTICTIMVIKPESTTTKLRVVFNVSSPSSRGKSLNDILHVGPVLQTDLTLLILKWTCSNSFSMRILKRCIGKFPSQQCFQRILFRSLPSERVQNYELKRVTFGVNCAPYLSIRTFLQLADDIQHQYPLASEILILM